MEAPQPQPRGADAGPAGFPRLSQPRRAGGPSQGGAGVTASAESGRPTPRKLLNCPEEQEALLLQQDIQHQGLTIAEVHIDRAYVHSPIVEDVRQAGGQIFTKPWAQRAPGPGLFSKLDFTIDLGAKTITCPAGEVEPFEPGQTVAFDPEACGACPQRAQCTQAASGQGRTVTIAHGEAQQQQFRKLQQTRKGRAALRERTAVEHAAARLRPPGLHGKHDALLGKLGVLRT